MSLRTDKRQGAVSSDLTLRSSQNMKYWHLHHCPSKVQSCGWLICHLKHKPYQSCGLLISQLLLISKKECSPLFNDWLWIHADSLISNDYMVKKEAEWWSYYCLGTSFSCQWGNQKLWLGQAALSPWSHRGVSVWTHSQSSQFCVHLQMIKEPMMQIKPFSIP